MRCCDATLRAYRSGMADSAADLVPQLCCADVANLDGDDNRTDCSLARFEAMKANESLGCDCLSPFWSGCALIAACGQVDTMWINPPHL